MKAHDLILLLQTLPPETEVSVWIDGEQHEIYLTDTIDYAEETNSAQINVVNSDAFAEG